MTEENEQLSAMEQALQLYYEAAAALSEAVTAEAESWIRFKEGIKGCTDGQADRMATAETKGAVILKEALLDIAHVRLDYAGRGAALRQVNDELGPE